MLHDARSANLKNVVWEEIAVLAEVIKGSVLTNEWQAACLAFMGNKHK